MESQTPKWVFDFEHIKQEVLSDRQEIRGRAMQQLLMQAKKDPQIQPAALEVFRAGLNTAQDYWTAGNAARGIELIAGPNEGRTAWLTLLYRSPVEMVAYVASILNDPFYIPTLINLLEVRPEIRIRTAVICTLGRMKDPSAFQTLVEHLAITELRPHAVGAGRSRGCAGDF